MPKHRRRRSSCAGLSRKACRKNKKCCVTKHKKRKRHCRTKKNRRHRMRLRRGKSRRR